MWRETLSAYKAEVFNQLADITPQGISCLIRCQQVPIQEIHEAK